MSFKEVEKLIDSINLPESGLTLNVAAAANETGVPYSAKVQESNLQSSVNSTQSQSLMQNDSAKVQESNLQSTLNSKQRQPVVKIDSAIIISSRPIYKYIYIYIYKYL